MNKAIFLDKDGTLIENIPYNVNCNAIKLVPGVVSGLRKLQSHGYRFIIITNQSGLAKGYFTVQELEKVRQHLEGLFNKQDIKLDGFYYCPHYSKGIIEEYSVECNCRKPKPGLLLKAAIDLSIDVSRSWFIGDSFSDVEAGNACGCKTILLRNKRSQQNSSKPYSIAVDFPQATQHILNSDQA